MSDSAGFGGAPIRFVTDPLVPLRDVTLGAVVGRRDTSEWQVRISSIPATFPKVDERQILDAVQQFIDTGGMGVDRAENRRDLVQITRPRPLAARSEIEAMAQVARLLRLGPAASEFRFVGWQAAMAAVLNAYAAQGLKPEAGRGHPALLACRRVHGPRTVPL